MAESKKVTANDVIQKDIFGESTKSAEKFYDIVVKTTEALTTLSKETTKQLTQAKKGETASDIKKQNELLDKSAKQRKLIAEAKKLEAEATLAVTKAKAAEENQEKKTNAEKLKAIKALEQQSSVYAQQSKRLQDLRKQYRDLALSENKSAEETKKLKNEIQALDKQLKGVDADMGVFNRNVGDYKNQVKEALAETDLFSAGLGKLDNSTKAIIAGFGGVVDQLKKVRQAEDAAATGAEKIGKSLKAAGITALIAVIASLFSFFTSSREGALQFDLALNKLKGTLSGVLGAASRFGSGIVDQFKSIAAATQGFYLKLRFQGDAANKKFAEAAELQKSANEKLSTSFDGTSDAITNQIDALDALTRKIFEYEDQIRVLQISLAKVKMDEEDLNEIQADNTISLNEQKDALEGAIKLRLEGARIARSIADKELEIARDQFTISLRNSGVTEDQIALTQKLTEEQIFKSGITIKTGNAELDALQDKYLAQLTAADALDDLDRQEATRKRQLAQTEIINQVELIRSKKLGADAQVLILTKQVADEKIQLEERERLNDLLRQKQLDAQNEEIALLAQLQTKKKEQAISETELNDLIATTDAVVLAGKLKLFRDTRLSEEQTLEVAKVVNEAQLNEIANNERIAKFEEEKVERLAKIRKLDQEIAIIQQNTQLQALGEVGANKADEQASINQLLFTNENVFNNKIISEAQRLSDERIAIAEEEARIKRELLDKQFEIDKEAINKSVSDEQEKASERAKLIAKYNQDVQKLNSDSAKVEKDLNDKKAKDTKLLLEAQTELVVNYITRSSEALTEALDQRYAQQSDQQQRSIDRTNANIAKQQELASRGQANQLAFEEAKLAQQQLAQQDAAKKQAKIQDQIQTAQALLNAYNAELKQEGATPATAGARAIADVLLFKGLAKGIVQFAAEGNNDVQGPGTTKSDSIPFMLSKHEGVVKAEANMENPGAVKALNDGTFKQLFTPKIPSTDTGSTAQNISNSIMLQNASKIESLLEEISNKPTSQLSADALGNIVETIIEKKTKKKITHKRGRI